MLGRICLLLFLGTPEDEYGALLERLRLESQGEYAKVIRLDRETGLAFLRERFAKKQAGCAPGSGKPAKEKPTAPPPREESLERIETIRVGGFSIELGRRQDGAFGIGEVRRGEFPL